MGWLTRRLHPGGAYCTYIPALGRILVTSDVTFIQKLYRMDGETTISRTNESRSDGDKVRND